MDSRARAEAWLTSDPTEIPVEEALVACADLHIVGEAELATRLFRLVRHRAAPETPWALTRVTILAELDTVHVLRREHGALLDALARATLAGDESVIDDFVEKHFGTRRAPSPHMFFHAPHLYRAYADAIDIPEQKRRIHDGVRVGIAVTVIGAIAHFSDLLPLLLQYMGFRAH